MGREDARKVVLRGASRK